MLLLNRPIHHNVYAIKVNILYNSDELQLSLLQQTSRNIKALFVQNETSEGQSIIAEPSQGSNKIRKLAYILGTLRFPSVHRVRTFKLLGS